MFRHAGHLRQIRTQQGLKIVLIGLQIMLVAAEVLCACLLCPPRVFFLFSRSLALAKNSTSLKTGRNVHLELPLQLTKGYSKLALVVRIFRSTLRPVTGGYEVQALLNISD